LREFLGPAPAADWYKPANSGFSPAAEVVKDGDDAVVRVELPGVDVEKDVNVEVELENGVSRLVIQANTVTSTPTRKTVAPCGRSGTGPSAGRSSCRPTSPARPSRLRTTPEC
jgi:HSP20 family molecular chaperone IbpA